MPAIPRVLEDDQLKVILSYEMGWRLAQSMRLCLKRKGERSKEEEEKGGIGKERQSLNCPPIYPSYSLSHRWYPVWIGQNGQGSMDC